MFLHMCVCPQWGCYPSMHCRWYPSMPCSRSPRGWYPSMRCRFPGPHPGGSWEGSGGGGSTGPQSRGKLRRIWPGGLQVHTQGESWRGSGRGQGCLQANIQGVSKPTPRGYLLQRGVSAPGAMWRPPPPPMTATAAIGTHPTGMHSCLSIGLIQIHTDTQWIYLTHKSYIWCLPTERSRKDIEVEGFYCVPKKPNKIVTVIMSTDYFDVDKWVTLGPACNEICYNGHSTPVTTSRFFCTKITDNDVKRFCYNELFVLHISLVESGTRCIFDRISKKKSLIRGHVIFLLWSWDTSHEQRNTFDIIYIIILTHKHDTSNKVLFA